MSIAEQALAPAEPQFEQHRASRFLPPTFASLRHKGYLCVWLGVVFASGASWMEQVSYGWLAYERTGSPFLLGSLTGARAIPFLAFSTLAGVAADRLNRKGLLLVSQVIVLALYCMILALLLLDRLEVWHLFAASIGASTAWSFNAPVRQALIRDLVPKEDLVNAVALQSGAHNLTRILGLAAEGLLMAAFGGAGTFALVIVTFLGVMVVTVMIPPVAARVRATRTGFWSDLKDGVRFVATNKLLRCLMPLALVPMVVSMSYQSMAPVFARDVFGLDARGAGELLGVSGIGAMVSTLLVASLGASFNGKGKVMLGCGLFMGISLVLYSLSSSYLLALVAIAFVGMFSTAYSVLTSATIQLMTPQEYMGRVSSIYMLDRGLMPLGSLIAGAIAEVLGGPAAMAIMGALCAGLILSAGAVMREVRELR